LSRRDLYQRTEALGRMPVMQSERIGRYRLERLLTAHAPCETFAGWDEQLDRQVLVTRIPLDGVDDTARDIWRRDIRRLSGITHPGLVHVLDILAQDGCDWVVSEWIEGDPTDVLVARQPLAGSEVARLGAELAEVLAALHQHAVRHGGVRPANVLVTAGGHIKLGGGCPPPWCGPRIAEPPATEPAAPAREPLDSDLRGLGEVLLVLAGTQPGGAPMLAPTEALLAPTCGTLAAPLASIIARCLGEGDEPPFEGAQQVAAALRALDTGSHRITLTEVSPVTPAPRPRRPAIIAAAILLVAGLIAITAWQLFALRRPLAVAVMPVEAPTDSEPTRLAALAVDTTISSELASLPGIVVVAGREVQALRKVGRSDAEIARQLAVQERVEIHLSYPPSSQGMRIDLARLRARDGRVEWKRGLEAATWEPAVARELVGELLRGAYQGSYASSQSHFSKANPETIRIYLALIEKERTGKLSPDRRSEITALATALDEAPEFREGWILLTRLCCAVYAMRLDDEARAEYERVRDRALALGASKAMMVPLDIWLNLRLGRTGEAVATARQLVRLFPGNPNAWQRLGEALSVAGQVVEAEAAFARSSRLHPSADALASLARARSSRGDHVGARAAVTELRAVAGESPTLTAAEAFVEMYAGNLVLAERLYRQLTSDLGGYLAFNNLGVCLFYQGKFSAAKDAFQRARELAPTSYLAARNLADTLMALNERELALQGYENALELIEPLLARGTLPLSALEARAVCLARLGHASDAARAVDSMVKANPHHPEVIFTAALVAAVSGERASALAWTRRALELHAPAVWFESPEFDRLRADHEFRQLFR